MFVISLYLVWCVCLCGVCVFVCVCVCVYAGYCWSWEVVPLFSPFADLSFGWLAQTAFDNCPRENVFFFLQKHSASSPSLGSGSM